MDGTTELCADCGQPPSVPGCTPAPDGAGAPRYVHVRPVVPSGAHPDAVSLVVSPAVGGPVELDPERVAAYLGLAEQELDGIPYTPPEAVATVARGLYVRAEALLAEVVRLRGQVGELRRFASVLAIGAIGARCELVAAAGEPQGRCRGDAVAIRWEHGFADDVCERHAETARQRGAIVVCPQPHDGTAWNAGGPNGD